VCIERIQKRPPGGPSRILGRSNDLWPIEGLAALSAAGAATNQCVAEVATKRSFRSILFGVPLILGIRKWIVPHSTGDEVEFGFTQSKTVSVHCDVLSSLQRYM
jgi:hypothetical protein